MKQNAIDTRKVRTDMTDSAAQTRTFIYFSYSVYWAHSPQGPRNAWPFGEMGGMSDKQTPRNKREKKTEAAVEKRLQEMEKSKWRHALKCR